VWVVVASLSAIGLVGILVVFGGSIASLGPLTGGCGLGPGVGLILLALAAVLVLVYAGLAGGLAVTGLIFFRRHSRWGPRLLIPANLLTMAFFYWSAVSPGQVAWAVVLVLFGAAPAIAVILLVWSLASQGTARMRVAELVVLGLLALPPLSAYVYGVNSTVTTALTPPPPPVAAAPTGCGPSTPSAAIAAP
jgi:hypothetical protein